MQIRPQFGLASWWVLDGSNERRGGSRDEKAYKSRLSLFLMVSNGDKQRVLKKVILD